MLTDWKNKKVGVLGLGVEGVSSVRFLVAQGASVTVLDKKSDDQIEKALLADLMKLGVRLVLGGAYLTDLLSFEVIVRSPGIRLDMSELQKAIKRGITVTSQTNLFFEVCPCPIIGVTGTKGKSTTSTLIFEMLYKGGKNAYLGGNVGVPPLDFLERLTPESVVVLELSSFQLQDLQRSPHIAVLLMITSEHLDYHRDILAYVEAKRNLVRFQRKDDFVVVNRDYPASNESDIHSEGKAYYVSRERETENGCYVREDTIWIKLDGKEKKIIDTKDILLHGKHNLENVCAAVMAVTLAGVEKEAIVSVLQVFKGLPHRLEYVGEKHGVTFYNDSLATIPEAAIEAIETFGDRVETLIAGGHDRGLDYTALGEYLVKSSVKHLILFAPSGERIWSSVAKALEDKDASAGRIKMHMVKSMHEAVFLASEETEIGKICLLSPAAASFGTFRDYKDRGEQFKREVGLLG